MPTSTSSSGTAPLLATCESILPLLGENVLRLLATCESVLTGRRSTETGGIMNMAAVADGQRNAKPRELPSSTRRRAQVLSAPSSTHSELAWLRVAPCGALRACKKKCNTVIVWVYLVAPET